MTPTPSGKPSLQALLESPLYSSEALLSIFRTCLDSMRQDNAVGAVYVLPRGENREMLKFGADEFDSEELFDFEFILLDGGNTAGDLWKCAFFPAALQYKFIDEAPLTQVGQTYTLEELYKLWDQLGDIPIASDDDVDGTICLEDILESFLHFPVGTPRERIWEWFEEQNVCFLVGEVQQGIRRGSQGKRV